MSRLAALLRPAALMLPLFGCDTGNVEPPIDTSAGVVGQPLGTRPYVAEQSGPISLGGGTSNRPVGPAEVVLGTGQFVNPPVSTTAGAAAALSGSDVTLDF